MGIFFIVLTALMLLVIYFDATRYIIPNWLVGMLLAAYPVMLLMTPHVVEWLPALGVMAATFVVGYGIFAMRWMGGGDIKLLTACALWAGFPKVLDLVLMTAVFGGLLALILILVRKFLPMTLPKLAAHPKLPRLLQLDQPLPYGLAIAAAFLLLLWQQQLPGLAL